jgi:hypothetical protein
MDGNPLQPLVNIIQGISCKLDTLIQKIGVQETGNGGTSGDGGTFNVNFKKERTDRGSIRISSINSTITTQICPRSSKRISIIVQNQGADNLYIAFDSQLTVPFGIKIDPGGVWSSETWTGEIYGISDGGLLSVVSMEEVLE